MKNKFNELVQQAFMVVICVLSIGCKHDPGPDCNDQQPVAADFVIEQKIGDKYYELDVIGETSQFIRFRALQDNLTYNWQINNNLNTSTNQIYTLGYFPAGATYTAKLSVQGEPNRECFPDDDGNDTKEKNFTSIALSDFPIIGVYKGVTSLAPTDTFYTTISYEEDIVYPGLGPKFYIRNFPNGRFNDLIYPFPIEKGAWSQQLFYTPFMLTTPNDYTLFINYYTFPNPSHENMYEYTGSLVLDGINLSGEWRQRHKIYDEATFLHVTTFQNFTYHGIKIN